MLKIMAMEKDTFEKRFQRERERRDALNNRTHYKSGAKAGQERKAKEAQEWHDGQLGCWHTRRNVLGIVNKAAIGALDGGNMTAFVQASYKNAVAVTVCSDPILDPTTGAPSKCHMFAVEFAKVFKPAKMVRF